MPSSPASGPGPALRRRSRVRRGSDRRGASHRDRRRICWRGGRSPRADRAPSTGRRTDHRHGDPRAGCASPARISATTPSGQPECLDRDTQPFTVNPRARTALGGGDTPPEIHRMAIRAVRPERCGGTASCTRALPRAGCETRCLECRAAALCCCAAAVLPTCSRRTAVTRRSAPRVSRVESQVQIVGGAAYGQWHRIR